MDYLEKQKYFAQVTGSLEKVAAAELAEFGAVVTREVPRGLYFGCDKRTLYRLVYESRTLQRILAPLINFRCHSEKYLYDQAYKNIAWTQLFDLDESFSIEANVSDSIISHSLYASQTLKDAICDSFRDQYGERPDFSPKDADIAFNLYIHDNWATISLDLSGSSMHKRGYRSAGGAAPLQETLAAAIIRLSGWNGETPLLDPMCGSGTLLAEALMHYCRIPAAYLKESFSLVHMPDFDQELWDDVCRSADAAIRPLPPGLIKGSDISLAVIETARENLSRLPFGSKVELNAKNFKHLPDQVAHTIVTNPPYGVRLGEATETAQLYAELGEWLRRRCVDSTAYVLCGSEALVSELRLRSRWKKMLKNADLECYLAKILIKRMPQTPPEI